MTTVQISRGPRLTTSLPLGQVICRRPTPQGEQLTLNTGTIAVYCVCTPEPHVFVFRTLARSEPGATRLMGVCPSVRLLVATHTRGRFGKIRDLFLYLERQSRDPSLLSDGFYVRVAALLAGRLPAAKVLESLLVDDDARN